MAQERIEGNVPLTVDITNSSVGDNLTYSWEFGDGSTSVDPSPQHVYNQTGTFNVLLTVTNIYGSNSKTSQVVVTQDTGDTQQDTQQDTQRQTRQETQRETQRETER